jgi:hypothetical protein
MDSKLIRWTIYIYKHKIKQRQKPMSSSRNKALWKNLSLAILTKRISTSVIWDTTQYWRTLSLYKAPPKRRPLKEKNHPRCSSWKLTGSQRCEPVVSRETSHLFVLGLLILNLELLINNNTKIHYMQQSGCYGK